MQGNSALTTRHLASGLSELEIAAFGPLSGSKQLRVVWLCCLFLSVRGQVCVCFRCIGFALNVIRAV